MDGDKSDIGAKPTTKRNLRSSSRQPATTTTNNMSDETDAPAHVKKPKVSNAKKGDAAGSKVNDKSNVDGGKAAKANRKSAKEMKVTEPNDVAQEQEEPQAKAKSKLKKIIVKGKAAVDGSCPIANTASVFCEGDEIFDATLNQTNIGNNNNKYFIIQLLEMNENGAKYYVYFHWGRVGYDGQSNLVKFGASLEEAKNAFRKKFIDKTKNEWENRDNFQKIAGKYDLIKKDYSAEKKEGDDIVQKQGAKDDVDSIPKSSLDPKVLDVVQMIFDIKMIKETVIEMQFDEEKLPLGKLTDDQIKEGYTSLMHIGNLLDSGKAKSQELQAACSEFYTRIPHSFGMKRPTLIDTKSKMKTKLEMLAMLSDLEVAMDILKEGDKEMDENPADVHYKLMDIVLTPVSASEDTMFKLIDDYLQCTHAASHSSYTMNILDIFEVEKPGESERFKSFGNRKMLWHGSRLTNWAGILSKGLRIAPKEAPTTGYMFGKGVYFADVSSKSANYAYASQQKNVGYMLLCEVGLGKECNLLNATYDADKLVQQGFDSVKGLGKMAPDSKFDIHLADGCVIPTGKLVPTGVDNKHGYTLNYNEYIVYDTSQIRMRYMVKVQFDFKY